MMRIILHSTEEDLLLAVLGPLLTKMGEFLQRERTNQGLLQPPSKEKERKSFPRHTRTGLLHRNIAQSEEEFLVFETNLEG
jgi:hypothetical protein